MTFLSKFFPKTLTTVLAQFDKLKADLNVAAAYHTEKAKVSAALAKAHAKVQADEEAAVSKVKNVIENIDSLFSGTKIVATAVAPVAAVPVVTVMTPPAPEVPVVVAPATPV